MKKHQLLLYVPFLSLSLSARAQGEVPTPPVKDSPLIELVKKKDSIINFNKLDDFDKYANTEEIDLNRKTFTGDIIHTSQSVNQDGQQSPPHEGELQIIEENEMSSDIPADIISIDNTDYDLSGYNKIKSLGNKTIIIGVDTVKQCSLVRVSEKYILRNWIDTVTQYDNTYYSFVKDSSVVLEIFHKKRFWLGGLSQLFEGVSINKVGQNSLIQISLSPNPTSTDCNAQFVLYTNGAITLKIINQNATVNKTIFNGNLESGNQSITFSVSELPPGTYTVFLEFDNNIYSSNLTIN